MSKLDTGRRNLLLPLLFAMVPLSSAFSTLVDGATKARDFSGQWSWVTTSNYTSTFTTMYIYLLVGVSVVILAGDILSDRRLLQIPYVVLAVPVLFSCLYIVRSDYQSAVNAFLSALVIAAVCITGVSRSDLRILAYLATATGVAAIVFGFINPARALIPCRIDKCSALNALFTSFFPQENVLAVVMIVGLVVVLFGLRGFARGFGATMIMVLIALSGSRTVTAAAIAITLLSLCFLHGKSKAFLGWLRGITAIGAGCLFTTSAVLFFIPLDPRALTGRGFIYNLLRGYWENQPLIGPGRSVLEYAFSIATSANYAISHEHGGLPYIIVNGGILGLLFFSYWLFRLLLTNADRDSWMSGLSLVLATTVGVVSITEPVWTYDLRSPAFWSLAIVCFTMTIKARNTNPLLKETISRGSSSCA